jgi:hypothetical protein
MFSNIIFNKLKFKLDNNFKPLNTKLEEKYKNLYKSNYKYNFEDLKDPEKNQKMIENSFFSNYQRLETMEQYKKKNLENYDNNDNNCNNNNTMLFIKLLTISIILYSSSKYYLNSKKIIHHE